MGGGGGRVEVASIAPRFDTLDYRMSYFSHIVIDRVVSNAFYLSSLADGVYSISITISINTVVACDWFIKGIDNAVIALFMFHYFKTIYYYLSMISFV